MGKLQKTYILLEEKFECLMFLIQNFNLLDIKLIHRALQNFKESLLYNKSHNKIQRYKKDFFNKVFSILTIGLDIKSMHFYFILELFYLLMDNDENLNKIYKKGYLRFFIGILRRKNCSVTIQSILFKIIAYLCKFQEFIKIIE